MYLDILESMSFKNGSYLISAEIRGILNDPYYCMQFVLIVIITFSEVYRSLYFLFFIGFHRYAYFIGYFTLYSNCVAYPSTNCFLMSMILRLICAFLHLPIVCVFHRFSHRLMPTQVGKQRDITRQGYHLLVCYLLVSGQ